MMREKAERLFYSLSTGFYGLLSVLFVFVLVTSFAKNLVDICARVGMNWRHDGNYVGLFLGVAAYILFLIFKVELIFFF